MWSNVKVLDGKISENKDDIGMVLNLVCAVHKSSHNSL